MIKKNWHHKNFTIDAYDEVSSTNSLIFDLAKNNQINHNHIILAASQTSGRGRLGRNWNSPLGNLYFSLFLKPQKNISEVSKLSFVAAAAMGEAILNLNKSANLQQKWPNDILIAGKKICGILLESDVEKGSANFVVLGIGVNINFHPDNTSFLASNLIAEGFAQINPEDLLKNFLDQFQNLYQKWFDFGFAPIRNLWLARAFNLNQEIIVNLPNQQLKGVFRDLDQDGNLVLEVDGVKRLISSGEVFNPDSSLEI